MCDLRLRDDALPVNLIVVDLLLLDIDTQGFGTNSCSKRFTA